MASNTTWRRLAPLSRYNEHRSEESGWRTKCVMLFPCSRFVSDTTADNAFKTMRLALVNRFGGYSDTTGAGGWSVGDDHNNLASGIVATERHCALSVSYKPNAIEDAWLQDFAEMYGRTLGQEWMHVEFHAIRVGHVKVR